MIRVILSLLLFLLTILEAHEPIKTDEEITKSSGLILDGEIISKKIQIKDNVNNEENPIYSYYVSYDFMLEEVLRGNLLKNEVIKISEYGIPDDLKNIGIKKVGDRFRYFSKEENYYNKKYSFPMDPNYVRPHLYGKPLDWKGDIKHEHNHDRPEKPLPDSKEFENLREQGKQTIELETVPSEVDKSNSFPWWLLGILGVIVALGFIFLKGKQKR